MGKARIPRFVRIIKGPYKGYDGTFKEKRANMWAIILDATGQAVVVPPEFVVARDDSRNVITITEDPKNRKSASLFIVSRDDVEMIDGHMDASDGTRDNSPSLVSLPRQNRIVSVSYKNNVVADVSNKASKGRDLNINENFFDDFFKRQKENEIKSVFKKDIRNFMNAIQMEFTIDSLNSHISILETASVHDEFKNLNTEEEQIRKMMILAHFFIHYNNLGINFPHQNWMKPGDISPNDDPAFVVKIAQHNSFIKNVDMDDFMFIIKKMLSTKNTKIIPSVNFNVDINAIRQQRIKFLKKMKTPVIQGKLEQMRFLVLNSKRLPPVGAKQLDRFLKELQNNLSNGNLKIPNEVDKKQVKWLLDDLINAQGRRDTELYQSIQNDSGIDSVTKDFLQNLFMDIINKKNEIIDKIKVSPLLRKSVKKGKAYQRLVDKINQRIDVLNKASRTSSTGRTISILKNYRDNHIGDYNFISQLNKKSNSVEARIILPFHRQYIQILKDIEDEHLNQFKRKISVIPQNQKALDLKKKIIDIELQRFEKALTIFSKKEEIEIFKHLIQNYVNIIHMQNREIRNLRTDLLSSEKYEKLKILAVLEANSKFHRIFNSNFRNIGLQSK